MNDFLLFLFLLLLLSFPVLYAFFSSSLFFPDCRFLSLQFYSPPYILLLPSLVFLSYISPSSRPPAPSSPLVVPCIFSFFLFLLFISSFPFYLFSFFSFLFIIFVFILRLPLCFFFFFFSFPFSFFFSLLLFLLLFFLFLLLLLLLLPHLFTEYPYDSIKTSDERKAEYPGAVFPSKTRPTRETQ